MTEEELKALEEKLKKQKEELDALDKKLKGENDDEKVKRLVQSGIDDALKDIKGKLDKAYTDRDEALKKIASFEQKEKDQEIEKLKQEGKLQEAHEKEISTLKAENQVLKERNIELTRDIDVRDAIAPYTFKTNAAKKVAQREIVDDLVCDDKGIWKHKSGISVEEAVKIFCEKEDNSYLFKQPKSSGAGGQDNKGNVDPTKKTSMFSLTNKEAIERTKQRLGRK